MEGAHHTYLSIDLGLVTWTILDTLGLELLLDVLRDAPLYGDGIHPTHVFI